MVSTGHLSVLLVVARLCTVLHCLHRTRIIGSLDMVVMLMTEEMVSAALHLAHLKTTSSFLQILGKISGI